MISYFEKYQKNKTKECLNLYQCKDTQSDFAGGKNNHSTEDKFISFLLPQRRKKTTNLYQIW